MMYHVHAGEAVFEINENASACRLYSDHAVICSPEGADFFRVHLDDGEIRDLTVHSADQTGTVSGEEDHLTITYTSLKAEDGRTFPIHLVLTMQSAAQAAEYTFTVENHSDVRVNEVQYPFIELEKRGDAAPEEEVLYWPVGVGTRQKNPQKVVFDQRTGYMNADDQNIWMTSTYPFPFSMGWYGIENGDHFFYLGEHDAAFRTVSFSLGCAPLHHREELLMAVSHYPAARPGEKLTYGTSVFSVLNGNWQAGADLYRSWADTWYRPAEPKEWVRQFSGWQRVILKHQFGKIFFRYKDLVRIYENGRKYGLDTLLVFGWWKGRFDNGYPVYEPDEALGGAEELKEAIAEVQRRKGRVILYNNGVLIDVSTDYYREEGYQLTKKNIDNCEYREYYQFANNGMMLRTFGYKSFSSACHATEGWKKKLLENAAIKMAFNPDSLFFDQLGGHLPRFCFDTTHKHGPRIDQDLIYKIENVSAIRSTLPEEKCIGTENVVDALAPHFDFSHGCENAWYSRISFPALYRYTFPETVITNRMAHDDEPGYQKALAYAFVYGLRFDVSIYRGRTNDISELPNYGMYLRYLLEIKTDYARFFYDGTFAGPDPALKLPDGVIANRFRSPEQETLLVVWNDSCGDAEFCIEGVRYHLSPNEFRLIEKK